MYNNVSDWSDYDGDINIGDLLELKPNMMLVEPEGPVIVIDSDNESGIYKVMYTKNNYEVTCYRMEVKRVVNEAG